MRKIVLLMSATVLLAGCSQAEDSAEDTAAAAPVTRDPGDFGPVLVTLPDGTQTLNVSTGDGISYSAPFEGEPGTWSVEGDRRCVDPAGDEPQYCFTRGPTQADGSWENTREDGQALGSFRRLGDPATEGQYDGSYLGTLPDGSTRLTVWTSDGRTYRASSPQRGTWRVVDGKRCGKLDTATEETCRTPGVIAEDGSFISTPDDPALEPITVMPLD